MKIGVDIRVLMDRNYSGVSEYTANLLSAILSQDRDNEYSLFYNSWKDKSLDMGIWSRKNARLVATRWPNKIFNYCLQKIFFYPCLDKVLGQPNIFWSPHFNFTRLTNNIPQIITVHDLSFLRYPEFFTSRQNFWHRALNVRQALAKATAIVAVSENTKRDIIELAGVASEKITVIYSGNNLLQDRINSLEQPKLSQDIESQLGKDKFILYLGTIEPRKNISGLIQAYHKFRQANPDKKIKLVLAGGKGWKNRAVYQEYKESPYRADILFLGYISKKDKEILYSLASVFVYPSYYEGFGFPPLEAMSCGCPVICSNVSSLPEVVAEAAILINPFKPEEIKQALEMVFQDENLRQSLITKGYERAKFFSWDKAAQAYLELFRKMTSGQ